MRCIAVLPIVAALALTACGSGEEEATTVADAAEAIAESPQPLPGQYRTTTQLLELSAPGLPEDARAMMQAQLAQSDADVTTSCLTEEQAANSQEEMLKQMTQASCTVQRFDVSGGNIDAAMSCPAGNGITGDVTVTGTMGETGSDMEMSFSTNMPGAGEATFRMQVVSERIGDCT